MYIVRLGDGHISNSVGYCPPVLNLLLMPAQYVASSWWDSL